MKFSTLIALSILASPLAAQTPVWQDDFNDGVVDPMWTITFSPLQFWSTGEFGGYYNFDGLTAPFGAFNETFELEAAAPAQSGALTFNAGMVWAENQWVSGGMSVLDTKIELLDASGAIVARIYLNDTSTSAGPDMIFEAGGSSSSIPALPQSSSADIEIARDGSGNWTYDVSGAIGTFSGSFGSDAATIEKVKFYTTGVSLGVGQPPLGECDIDYLELYSAPTGPTIVTSGSCPGPMTIDASNMTPNGPVVFAYGTAGSTLLPSGPCAGLNLPVSSGDRLANAQADANGNASLSGNAPANACGSISVFAVDGATCTVTNVIAL